MKVISTLNRIRKLVPAIRFTISPFLFHWLSQPCTHICISPGVRWKKETTGAFRHWMHDLVSRWKFAAHFSTECFRSSFRLAYVTVLYSRYRLLYSISARGVTGGKSDRPGNWEAETATHLSAVKFGNYSTHSACKWSMNYTRTSHAFCRWCSKGCILKILPWIHEMLLQMVCHKLIVATAKPDCSSCFISFPLPDIQLRSHHWFAAATPHEQLQPTTPHPHRPAIDVGNFVWGLAQFHLPLSWP